MTRRPTLLDGGMGRELLRIGAPFRQPEWSALALTEGPERVVEAHRNFIAAGAEVITTNAYAVVPFHISAERFTAEGRDLAHTAGRLAREAADGADRAVRVAGSLPPLFGSYEPELFDQAAAPDVIDPLVDGQRAHVDLWLAETLGSIAEAYEVRRALDRAGDTKRLWISYALHRTTPGLLLSGESVDDATAAALDLGATAVLFNCSPAEAITDAVRVAVPRAGTAAEVGGYANRFTTAHTDETHAANSGLSRFRDDLDPPTYASMAHQWVADGASLVGGCCGIEPAHIAALAAAFD
ncbi:MAG: homocysteine S-methyltransferase family protein [Ilumatobacteraceae bacterium]